MMSLTHLGEGRQASTHESEFGRSSWSESIARETLIQYE